MKIRIKGNSLRLRLTMTDVAHFEKHNYLEEVTEFGSHTFIYALSIAQNHQTLFADFEQNKITMYVPETLKNQWTNTDLVGLDAKMPIHDGKEMFLLLEKDWACMDATTEDQSENYPNPKV
jgi:hypothetical protein